MAQRKTRKFLLSMIVLAYLIGFGFVIGAYKLFPYTTLKDITDSVALVFEEWPVLTGSRPIHHLQAARHEGSGVTVNQVPPDQGDLVFMTGFFGDNPGLQLLRRDGTVVARWEGAYSEIFSAADPAAAAPETDWNVDIHGAVLLPDGSVVFNFEYFGFVRLDRCGTPLWARSWSTHHSVERAADGGFWVPGRRSYEADEPTPFPPFRTPLLEDTLLKISTTGEALAEISVPGIFYDNGLEALLTANGHAIEPDSEWDEEIVHLNKIAALPPGLASRFPMFEAGDLALSFRHLNLLMVYSPATGAVKWHQVGPWLRQHDPQFAPDGRIVLFNNNIYRMHAPDILGRDFSFSDVPSFSNIMAVDPATGVTEVLYEGRDGQELLSVIRGKVGLRPGGGFLITEFEGGRVFEVDAAGAVIWEYINRYDEDTVAEVTGARVYPESYFEVTDWSCDSAG